MTKRRQEKRDSSKARRRKWRTEIRILAQQFWEEYSRPFSLSELIASFQGHWNHQPQPEAPAPRALTFWQKATYALACVWINFVLTWGVKMKKAEGSPQIQILRGGNQQPWCSIMSTLKYEDHPQCNDEAMADMVRDLRSQKGFRNLFCSYVGHSLVFDLQLDPTLPRPHVERLQKSFARLLENAIGIKLEVVPYQPPRVVGRL